MARDNHKGKNRKFYFKVIFYFTIFINNEFLTFLDYLFQLEIFIRSEYVYFVLFIIPLITSCLYFLALMYLKYLLQNISNPLFISTNIEKQPAKVYLGFYILVYIPIKSFSASIFARRNLIPNI
jgi:hypothetical protein